MQSAAEAKALVAEFAGLYRATRIAKGMIDDNMDMVVAYACDDLMNLVKSCGDALAVLRDEVTFQRECLEKISAGAR